MIRSAKNGGHLGKDGIEKLAILGKVLPPFFSSAFVLFVPLLPFLVGSGNAATYAAIAAGMVTLFLVGSLMSILTGKSPLRSGLRMFLIGAGAAAITYGVGRALHVSTGI